ncbi:hypothetical protein Aru02nite_57650 [Actinocatenispora rupis]|uniref:Uncharacterized protein n=1 Tax=Actinocatenispora rupis TaxID=519421 RepID=A0A8J3J309_9ACTN|nr:hypothetical protein Aru02nite_57650 [Actinocatenispora rupis]
MHRRTLLLVSASCPGDARSAPGPGNRTRATTRTPPNTYTTSGSSGSAAVAVAPLDDRASHADAERAAAGSVGATADRGATHERGVGMVRVVRAAACTAERPGTGDTSRQDPTAAASSVPVVPDRGRTRPGLAVTGAVRPQTLDAPG